MCISLCAYTQAEILRDLFPKIGFWEEKKQEALFSTDLSLQALIPLKKIVLKNKKIDLCKEGERVLKYKVVYMPFEVNGKKIDDIKGAICELDPEQRPEEYTIFINTDYPEEVQQEVLKHELKHLELNHFKRILSREITAAEAELEAHNAINEMQAKSSLYLNVI